GARPGAGPDRRVQGVRVPGADRRRARRRAAGRLGRLTRNDHANRGDHARRVPPKCVIVCRVEGTTNRHARGLLVTTPVQDLITRSNRLGADPRNTNYAGGNTSAKGTAVDPVTGTDVELVWVKGSGGDLGTLTPAGLAVLRLDRLRALVDVYPGVDREDEMVA